MEKPTANQYRQYQKMYDWYNAQLFNGTLPECLLILSRKAARVCGHFAPDAWKGAKDEKTHEMSLNPAYLAIATHQAACQTIVHEMVHLWQYEFGKPSRPGYHNMEWANKMENVGLMPSPTGKPGGKKTGQQMSDYAIEGGLFMEAFEAMPKNLLLPFTEKSVLKLASKSKNKYLCPQCLSGVWGKLGLSLSCYCGTPMKGHAMIQVKK